MGLSAAKETFRQSYKSDNQLERIRQQYPSVFDTVGQGSDRALPLHSGPLKRAGDVVLYLLVAAHVKPDALPFGGNCNLKGQKWAALPFSAYEVQGLFGKAGTAGKANRKSSTDLPDLLPFHEQAFELVFVTLRIIED